MGAMDETQNYQILLFYKYVSIEDPEQLKTDQEKICRELGLTGRIIIAHEGINVTVEGTKEAVREYMRVLTEDSHFSDIHFKKSKGTGNAFPKLSIKVRDEIVSLNLQDDFSPNETTGKRLHPEELRKWFEESREFVIIDMRNDYEHKVGKFEGSVCAPLKNFRDLPRAVQDELSKYKNKTVVTVCTGGVRCEKASGYLIQNGFTDVYQLDGGIVSYMEKYPNQDFKGKLYVFDARQTMGFETDSPEHEIISTCELCGTSADSFSNCKRPTCNRHYVACVSCATPAGHDTLCAVCRRSRIVQALGLILVLTAMLVYLIFVINK